MAEEKSTASSQLVDAAIDKWSVGSRLTGTAYNKLFPSQTYTILRQATGARPTAWILLKEAELYKFAYIGPWIAKLSVPDDADLQVVKDVRSLETLQMITSNSATIVSMRQWDQDEKFTKQTLEYMPANIVHMLKPSDEIKKFVLAKAPHLANQIPCLQIVPTDVPTTPAPLTPRQLLTEVLMRHVFLPHMRKYYNIDSFVNDWLPLFNGEQTFDEVALIGIDWQTIGWDQTVHVWPVQNAFNEFRAFTGIEKPRT